MVSPDHPMMRVYNYFPFILFLVLVFGVSWTYPNSSLVVEAF